jgi:thiol-disulfide isomerase/thioredoxin
VKSISNHEISISLPKKKTVQYEESFMRLWKLIERKGIFLTLVLAVVLILAGCAASSSQGTEEAIFTENGDTGNVVLYFLWGNGCPHCAEAAPVLQELDKKYPQLNVRAYEVWYVEANQELYQKMADAHNLPEEGRGVPVIYLHDKYWMGFNEDIGNEVEDLIKTCIAEGCGDAGAGIMPGAGEGPEASGATNASSKEVSLFGKKIQLEKQSLLVSTLLISFVDGFNPCSIWVLTMLLALTLHTGSRRKVLIIGLIFLTVTAAVYGMFIAGLFTFLSIVSFVGWIQVVVALVSLFFAAVNIKDYFWYKEGLSFTIADEQKPGIARGIRRVMDAGESFWSMAAATVVLAAGVSLVEFSCTAGFPVLWTNLLTAQKVTAGMFALLLLVYMVIYQLDELGIFFVAVFTLKASRLEEKQGRILKLIGGMLMLSLAVVMLVRPQLMNSLSGALTVFAAAAVMVLLVLLLHRRILPAYGIWIGTEAEGKRRAARKRAQKKPVKKH